MERDTKILQYLYMIKISSKLFIKRDLLLLLFIKRDLLKFLKLYIELFTKLI